MRAVRRILPGQQLQARRGWRAVRRQRLDFGLQAVTEAVHRTDQLAVFGAQAGTQPGHALGNHFLADRSAGPQGVDDVLPRQHFTGAAQQQDQQCQWPRLDLDRAGVYPELQAALVHAQRATLPQQRCAGFGCGQLYIGAFGHGTRCWTPAELRASDPAGINLPQLRQEFVNSFTGEAASMPA